MMDLPKLEAEAGENAGRVLELLEACDGDELAAFLAGLTRGKMQLVLYAVASGLLGQERANKQLAAAVEKNTATIRDLKAGNIELIDRNKVLEEIRDNQQRRISGMRTHLKKLGVCNI